MYKIIGQDGKEYGPVGAEQIRQWITEGRVEQRTPVFADGATDWNFIGLLPEFAGFFSGSLPPPLAPKTIALPIPSPRTNRFATAGLVCGILSVTCICCCAGVPFNILGMIFSIIALVQISENPQLHQGRTLAIVGLILSAISSLLMVFAIASGHTHININTSGFNP
ncbi:MAG TPA: DUF4190 domain-containing protein [Verrucomicrobiae bacterium]|nr:DUF4190 domain-containing protein [Verrucomicrobiae bacterium]